MKLVLEVPSALRDGHWLFSCSSFLLLLQSATLSLMAYG